MPFDGKELIDGKELNPVAKTLIDARGFLERGWCVNFEGKTALGAYIDPRNPSAVQWCLWGALRATTAACDQEGEVAVIKAASILSSLLPGQYMYRIPHQFIWEDYLKLMPYDKNGKWSLFGDIASFNNDQKSVEPVLEIVDLAIAKAMKDT